MTNAFEWCKIKKNENNFHFETVRILRKRGFLMNTTILQAQLLYNEMGKSEKKVADWLISHPGDNLPMSISELAELCESSESTIVRFARRLGFSGYRELKISVAGEQEKKVVLPTIDENDSCVEIL